MPFKLTKDETKQRDELMRRLSEASDKIAQAVDAFNAALETAKAPVDKAERARIRDLKKRLF